MSKGILYDSTLCVRCEGCVNACKAKWDLPRKVDDHLGAGTWLTIEDHGGHFVRRSCMHCEDPACASVCPVAALEKTPAGPVVYHADKCIGCRYCMMACPFQVPRYEWERAAPRIRKCVMCYDRIEEGGEPACTMICPVGALKFGERDELLAEARKRLREHPDRYHPHIYGEKEVAGTGVLLIAAVSPAELGLPADVPTDSLPKRTWEVLSRLPGVVAVGAAFCVGTWWVIQRRDRFVRVQVDGEAGAEEPPEEVLR